MAGVPSRVIGNDPSPGGINPVTGQPYPISPQGTQVGPTPQQVLDAGGTWSSNSGKPGNTYSLPIGGGGGGSHPGGPNGYDNSGALAGLLAAFGNTNTQMPTVNPNTPPPVSGPGFAYRDLVSPAPGPLAHIGPMDTGDAERAAFARAKDQTGQAATGAMAGLRSALGGHGMLGSGAESKGIQRLASTGLGQLGEASREQAINSSALAERTATTNHAGDIAQRGQDVSTRGQDIQNNQAFNEIGAGLAKTGYEGAISQRGQNIQNQQAAANQAMEQAKLKQQQQLAVLQGLMGALGKH